MPENLVLITAVRMKAHNSQEDNITHYCYIENYLGKVLTKEEFITKFSLHLYLGGVRVRNEIGSVVTIVEGSSPYLATENTRGKSNLLSLPRI